VTFDVYFNDAERETYIYDIHEFTPKVQKELEISLKEDRLGMQQLLNDFKIQASNYRYDVKKQQFHVDIIHQLRLRKAITDFIEMGPDTWMEGDILLTTNPPIEIVIRLASIKRINACDI